MDINCISKCTYQSDGKCALTELPPAPRRTAEPFGGGPEDGGCPYFSAKPQKLL